MPRRNPPHGSPLFHDSPASALRAVVSSVAGCWLLAVAWGALLASPASALPASPDRVVYPTGEWPADIANVQAAIDLGGTVLLKATDESGEPTAFQFGPPTPGPEAERRVVLNTDVALLGESTGNAMTTIAGGFVPVIARQPKTFRIEGLRFDKPGTTAIQLQASTGARVVGNHISRVVGTDLGGGFEIGHGIIIFGDGTLDTFSGSVVIEGNVVEDLHAELAQAIGVHFVSAEIEIFGNRLLSIASKGVVVNFCDGPAWVQDNDITSWEPAVSAIFSFAGVAVRGEGAVPRRVVGNRILASAPGLPFADGIWLNAVPSMGQLVVERNEIALNLGGTGILAVDGVTDASIASNQIGGTADFGIEMVHFLSVDAAAANSLVGNNFERLDAAAADLILGPTTRDTLVVGAPGTVIDLGTDNRITGMTAMGLDGAPGPQIGTARTAWIPGVGPFPPSGVDAPDEVVLTGASGIASYEVTVHFSGDFDATEHGLIAATPEPGVVVDDPANDVRVALETGVGVTYFPIPVPPATRHLRVSLFDEATDGDDDLDLFLYDPDGTLLVFSASPTSEEQVDVPRPDAGEYTVVVHGWQTDGPDAAFTLFHWVLGDTDEGNLEAVVPSSVAVGDTPTVELSWIGLEPGERYLGAVGYHDAEGELGQTLVTIDP